MTVTSQIAAMPRNQLHIPSAQETSTCRALATAGAPLFVNPTDSKALSRTPWKRNWYEMESSSAHSSIASTTVSSDNSPPQNPRPRKKAKHVDSKYQAEWSYKYRMSRSSKGKSYAFCDVCHFSVASGGVHQVKRHCLNKKHTNKIKALRAQPILETSLTTHLSTQHSRDQVTLAELYFARFEGLRGKVV